MKKYDFIFTLIFFPSILYSQFSECTISVNCQEGATWQKHKDAVVVVKYTDISTPCSCTGTLINNTSVNKKLYLLTSGHCINSVAEVESVNIIWNYESDCAGQIQQGFLNLDADATLVAISYLYDFALLEIHNAPQIASHQRILSGWDRSGDLPSSTVSINHPIESGNLLPKRISIDNDMAISGSGSFSSHNCVDGYSPPSNSLWKVKFDLGYVRTGVSGSALFNSEKRLIGNASSVGSGSSILSCTPINQYYETAYYQKISSYWDKIKQYLDPESSGVLKLDEFDPSDDAYTASQSYEPNDLLSKAESVFPILSSDFNGFLRSYIYQPNEEDYFKFYISGAGNLTLNLKDLPLGTNYDLYLYNINGTQIAASQNSGTNIEQVIFSHPIPLSDTHVTAKIKASTGAFSVTKPYKLEVNWSPCYDTYEPNNSPTSATELFPSLGNTAIIPPTISSIISDANDVDWHRIIANQPGTLTIKLLGLPKDYNLALRKASGTLLAQSLNPNTENEQVVYHINNVPDAFYAVVYSANGESSACSNYQLAIEWQPDAPCIPISLSTQIVAASNSMAQDGAVLLNITGGQAPLSILWSSGQTTQDLTGIMPGQYSVTVTGSDGCAKSATVNVGVQGAPDPFCFGTTTLTQPSGSFSDGSGSSSDYSPYSNCRWLISPVNASSVTLSFPFFHLAAGDLIEVFDGNSANAPLLATLNQNSSPDIYHATGSSLYVRFTSDGVAQGQGWNATYTSQTNVGGPKLVAYEYWFDDNASQRVQAYFTPITVKQINTSIPTDGLTFGAHRFHIRFLDEYDNWSSVLSQFFVKQPPSVPDNTLEEYEYWFDDDYANRGSGGSSGGQTFELNETIYESAQLSNGVHRFHVRFKDRAGNWSSVLSQFFIRQSIANQPNLIKAYRYWFDMNDANMQTITLPNPVNPYSLNVDINTTGLSAGMHTVHFQFLDINANWSSVTSDQFNNLNNPVIALFTPQTTVLCNNGSVTFINNSVGANTYLWDFGDGTTSTAFQPAHLYTQPGEYPVTLTATNTTNGFSQTYTLPTPIYVDAINLQISGDNNLCIGNSLQLTASGAATYEWSPATGLNTTTGSVVVASPTVSTLYTVIGTTTHGCVKTNTIFLTVNSGPQVVINAPSNSICEGESITLELSGANVFTISPMAGVTPLGIKSFQLSPSATTNYVISGTNQCGTAQAGFLLAVLPNSTSNVVNAEICEGESYTFENQVYTTSGSYQAHYTAFNGCDSVITLNLTVLPKLTETRKDTICFGESIQVGNHVFSNTGTYQLWFNGSNGCDSLFVLKLTVLPLPTTPQILLSGVNELTCNVNAISYMWFLDGMPFATTSSPSINVFAEGLYTVQYMTMAGCLSPLSAPYQFEMVNTVNPENLGIKVFPNPTTGVLQIEHSDQIDIRFSLKKLDGRLIQLPYQKGTTLDRVDMSLLPGGVYIYVIETDIGIFRERVVKI